MKQPIERILAPLDYSEPAFRAAWVALAIARSMPASLTLLHIHMQEKALRETVLIDRDELARLTDETYPSLLRKVVGDPSAKLLRSAVQHSVAEVKEVAPSLHCHSDEICTYAKDHKVDLIVIGAKVHSKIHAVLLGNVTSEVLHKAPCPVIVVH